MPARTSLIPSCTQLRNLSPPTSWRIVKKRSPHQKPQPRRPRPVQLQRRLEDVLRLRLTPLPTSHPAGHHHRPCKQRRHLHLRHPRHLPHHPRAVVIPNRCARPGSVIEPSFRLHPSSAAEARETAPAAGREVRVERSGRLPTGSGVSRSATKGTQRRSPHQQEPQNHAICFRKSEAVRSLCCRYGH